MKTTPMLARADALAQRGWYVIDAEEQVLGRVATEAAKLLRGKGKPEFTPHVDCGDFVIIVNAERVRLTGRKGQQKMYHRHSGYPGGIKSTTARRVRDKTPERLVRMAVRGMLPKNRLGRAMLRKLKVYAGSEHPHSAQQPEPMSLRYARPAQAE